MTDVISGMKAYGEALFSLTEELGTTERVLDDVKTLSKVIEKSPEYLGISAVIFFSLICLVFAYAAFDSNKRMKKYKKTRLFGEVFNKMKGKI